MYKRNPGHLSSRGRGDTPLTLQICSTSKRMQQLSNPVCLRLKPPETEISSKIKATVSRLLLSVSAQMPLLLHAHCFALLFDVFNCWVCAATFAGSSHQGCFSAAPRRVSGKEVSENKYSENMENKQIGEKEEANAGEQKGRKLKREQRNDMLL